MRTAHCQGTHLASPAHSLPYAEVADDPGQQQRERQLPPDTARMVQPARDLQSVAPANQTHVNMAQA